MPDGRPFFRETPTAVDGLDVGRSSTLDTDRSAAIQFGSWDGRSRHCEAAESEYGIPYQSSSRRTCLRGHQVSVRAR